MIQTIQTRISRPSLQLWSGPAPDEVAHTSFGAEFVQVSGLTSLIRSTFGVRFAKQLEARCLRSRSARVKAVGVAYCSAILAYKLPESGEVG